MSTADIIIIVISIVLGFLVSFILLPRMFDQLKKLWYLKLNSGSSNSMGVKNDMFYNADTGELEADHTPIH